MGSSPRFKLYDMSWRVGRNGAHGSKTLAYNPTPRNSENNGRPREVSRGIVPRIPGDFDLSRPSDREVQDDTMLRVVERA